MTTGAGRRRPHEKHTITLPSELVEAARERMRERGLPSFSAYVAKAIRRDLETRRFDELLAEMLAQEPMTDEERAWAENALYEQAQR